MTALAVLLAAATGCALPTPRRGRPRPSRSRGPHRRLTPTAGLALGLALGACLAVAGLGPVSAVVGLATGAGLRTLLARRERPAIAKARGEITAALPWCLDLLAAVTRAGAPPATGLAATAEALGVSSELGRRLREVAAALALGAGEDVAWCAAVEAGGESLRPVGECYAAAARDGSRLAGRLSSQAVAAREAAAAAASATAQRAGVRSVLPLGLCHLPAFVLVGIVPVVAAAFHKL